MTDDHYVILPYGEEYAAGLRALIERLDDWFEPTVWDDVAAAASPETLVLAVDQAEQVIGFVLVVLCGMESGRVKFCGVDPDWQRCGVGSAMFEDVVASAEEAGLYELWVETLCESIAYEPFERTRRFYEKLGFAPQIELGDRAGNGLLTIDWCLKLNGAAHLTSDVQALPVT